VGNARYVPAVDDMAIRCTECKWEVDDFAAIAEGWLYYSDGRDLLPYCPACARREFADDAPASDGLDFRSPSAETRAGGRRTGAV
jgi:hypothetical protein